MPKRLFRSRSERVIAGVCGGTGNYFNLDPVIVRILWLVCVLAFGFGLLLYLLAWIVVPEEPLPGVRTPAP